MGTKTPMRSDLSVTVSLDLLHVNVQTVCVSSTCGMFYC